MNMAQKSDTWLTIHTKVPKSLLHLLENGLRLNVMVGGTLAQLLCEQIGIPKDYLDNRIQTLFLNAKAVDNVETATVADGAVIALSAAMPGLVGATLRKGGTFSGLRAAISQRDTVAAGGLAPGTITLKLFNLVAEEIGPDLLVRGALFPGDRLGDYLDTAAPPDITIRQAEQPLTIAAAAALCAQHPWIGMQLELEKA
jgi:hypothetical protein